MNWMFFLWEILAAEKLKDPDGHPGMLKNIFKLTGWWKISQGKFFLSLFFQLGSTMMVWTTLDSFAEFQSTVTPQKYPDLYWSISNVGTFLTISRSQWQIYQNFTQKMDFTSWIPVVLVIFFHLLHLARMARSREWGGEPELLMPLFSTSKMVRPDGRKVCSGKLTCVSPKNLEHHLGVSKNRGTPKWMVKIMENPIKMDDLGVPLFSETSICQTKFFVLFLPFFWSDMNGYDNRADLYIHTHARFPVYNLSSKMCDQWRKGFFSRWRFCVNVQASPPGLARC